MSTDKVRTSTEIDVEISSIVSQILSDVLESSANQSGPSASYDRAFSQPTISNAQQEGYKAEETQSSTPYQTYTVKEMLNEILDSTIIRRPSIQLPSTSTTYAKNLPTSSPPPEYIFDPTMISRQIYNVSRGNSDSTTARVQCTVKEVLSELMDYTVFKKMDRNVNVYDYSMPSTSRTRSEHLEQTNKLGAYEIYRYRCSS